jgi:hypothetical protein
MEWVPWVVGLAIWAAGAGATWYVADQRGRYVEEAVVFGLLFGPFGVVVVGALPELDEDDEPAQAPADVSSSSR